VPWCTGSDVISLSYVMIIRHLTLTDFFLA
jgi:hypothetical protein